MKMKAHTSFLCLCLVLWPALVPQPAAGQDKIKEFSGSEDNPLVPLDRAFDFSSEEGDFRITWPEGCSRIKTRTPVDEDQDDGLEKEMPVLVSCDRHGEKGEGCSVTALFNVRSKKGGDAGPDEVIDRMQNMLVQFGADIVQQKPVQKEFGGGVVAEGLDVLANQTSGPGQVWLRGMLIRGDIYILAAWDLKGAVGNRPEYITFFNSFQPGAE